MKILITNDDGYTAKGILTLVKVLKGFGEVTVIAPKYHQSAMSLAVTMGMKPIAVKELASDDGVRWIYLDGTPASCVKFGVDNVFTDGAPDIVVSGVNHGMNAATAACYSATLGAAEEAAINGIPAIGVSLDDMGPDPDFSAFEKLFPAIFERIVRTDVRKHGTFYNINFPNLPAEAIKGVRVGHMGFGHWEKEFEDWDAATFGEVPAEEGETLYYMKGYFIDEARNDSVSDHRLVKEGYISVVVHNFDNTDTAECARLAAEGFNFDY